MKNNHILIFLIFLGLLYKISSIDFKEQFPFEHFNKNHWFQMLRFGISDKEAQISFRVKLRYSTYHDVEDPDDPKSIILHVDLYTDEDWKLVQKAKTCDEKNDYSQRKISISMPENGEWSKWRDMTVYPLSSRPHLFYLALTDCDMAMPQHPDYANEIHMELSIKNAENSHVSYEDEGNLIIYSIVAFIGFCYLILQSFIGRRNRLPKTSRNYCFTLWYIALILELISVFSELFNLASLHYNGWGLFGFDLLNHLTSLLSQNLIICIIILVCWNWCIPKPKGELDDDDDLLMILLGIFSVVQVLLLVVERIGRVEDISTFHDYESLAGTICFYSRIVLGFFFIRGLKFPNKYNEANKKEDLSKSKFSRFRLKFTIISIFYLAFLPISQRFVDYLPEYWRHSIMSYCVLFIQWFALIVFNLLFFGKDSQYSEIIFKEDQGFIEVRQEVKKKVTGEKKKVKIVKKDISKSEEKKE